MLAHEVPMLMQPLPRSFERTTARRRIEVKCQAVAEEGFRFLGDRVLDLSERGLLLKSEEPVAVGESVLVSFKAPKCSDWVDAEARVARVVAGRRDGDSGVSVGLRFTRVDPVDRILLRERLRRIPPPVPARRLRRNYAMLVRHIDLFRDAGLRKPAADEIPAEGAPGNANSRSVIASSSLSAVASGTESRFASQR